MNSQLQYTIQHSEAKWLPEAGEYVAGLFEDVYLPSHDINHHLRCWEYAKTLIENTSANTQAIDEGLLEGLLLACLFHDTGMVKTFEPEHGKESVKFFNNFINAVKTKPPYVEQIQEAIELHDQKNYAEADPIEPGRPLHLLRYLSIADDMDALGAIGVYRYAEIYLLRNIPLDELGIQIIENVKKRFNYFIQSTLSFPVLHEEWKRRYDDIITFFENYNYQVKRLNSIEGTAVGPVGVINHIKQFCIEKQLLPSSFLSEIKKQKPDIFTNAYFHQLHHELTR